MADSSKPAPKKATGDQQRRRTSAAGRQDGNYEVEFTAPPKGGPIPDYRPVEDDPK